jgi:hypothetical protein
VPTPADYRKQFIKAFERLSHHRERHDVLADFLDLAVCALRKTTVPPGPAADALEEQYMAVVKRNTPEDVRAMPELLGIAALAIGEGGCDFLGQVVVELELANAHMGQFFTPYDLSRMMAEMTMQDAGQLIAERGFVTVYEPASGAGGMIIAAADVLEKQGFDVARQLYVEAIDISPMCFKMTYLQTALRGVPATIRRGNTLSLEMFDRAVTPAFLSFHVMHQVAFEAWLKAGTPPEAGERSAANGAAVPRPSRSPVRSVRDRRQPDLFGREP